MPDTRTNTRTAVERAGRPANRARVQAPPVQPAPFRVLLVCTANMCRSATGELLLRRRASAADLPWVVESAGIAARPGLPMHPLALRALSSLGVDDVSFETQSVTRELVERQDLILAMADQHRAWLVARYPSVASRTYLLKQFAHLVSGSPTVPGGDPETYGAELLARAVAARNHVQPFLRDRDVEDPRGGREKRFVACARELDALFARIVPATN